MKVYLDNCCFNRPYDDQSQLRISLETQAKLYIQNLIVNGQIELITSYILHYENSQNPFEMRKCAIAEFMRRHSSAHIDIDMADKIKETADAITKTGIKTKDAYHVACALAAGCDYFLSTDDRLLKYHTGRMAIMDPIDFIKDLEGDIDE